MPTNLTTLELNEILRRGKNEPPQSGGPKLWAIACPVPNENEKIILWFDGDYTEYLLKELEFETGYNYTRRRAAYYEQIGRDIHKTMIQQNVYNNL